MKLRALLPALVVGALAAWSGPAWAHFGMVIPSNEMVMKEDPKEITLTFLFWHPFENTAMDLARPKVCQVVTQGRSEDLLSKLVEKKKSGCTTWEARYRIGRPGLYVFYMEPQPYWEPAEDCYIIHYTKTYVGALGDEEGWDQPLGLKTEIVPLSRPFGLYAGNAFQGRVLLDGKPVPGAEVEIEYDNRTAKRKAPTEYMVTQTVRADANGVFTYAAPWSGWWGFAALNKDSRPIKRDGKDKPVEIGAVVWVRFR
jgi:cobalt/nickel transport protein